MSLPSGPVYNNVNKVSQPFFDKILLNSGVVMEYYTCPQFKPSTYNGFFDTIHVNKLGRNILTDALAKILRNEKQDTIFCEMKGLTE